MLHRAKENDSKQTVSASNNVAVWQHRIFLDDLKICIVTIQKEQTVRKNLMPGGDDGLSQGSGAMLTCTSSTEAISTERILALSRTGKKSRTIAKTPTCATQPPSACSRRKAMNIPGERTAIQPSEATANRLSPA